MHMSVSINCKHINFYSDGTAAQRGAAGDKNNPANVGCKEASGVSSKNTPHVSGRVRRVGQLDSKNVAIANAGPKGNMMVMVVEKP